VSNEKLLEVLGSIGGKLTEFTTPQRSFLSGLSIQQPGGQTEGKRAMQQQHEQRN
jgi:hypothetical protein